MNSGAAPDAGTGSLTRRALLASAALPWVGCAPTAPISGGFSGIHPERGHLLRDPGAFAAPTRTHRTGVVIAGGGVAGLAAARALRSRGIEDFVMLELEDAAGGNSRAGAMAGAPHPLGAHYLPVPGDGAPEVQELLESLNLRRRVAGRWVYDERHLCHSPQERLFFRGEWQEGLLPVHDVGAGTLGEYQRFARAVARAAAAAPFTLPAARGEPAALHRSLDAMTFADWLQRERFVDPHLRWYLDYGCRDDYGADTTTVSAWAGLHYFASRHGFQPPGESDEAAYAVLTWPEGNGWLTRQLAQPLGDRLRCGQVVLRIAPQRHGVRVDAFDTATRAVQSWEARHCIVALPLFVAARVVENPPTFLREAAARVRYAPWLVANLQLREPLEDRPGAAPAWDNVLYGSAGLGYVDAGHQSLHPVRPATLLTWYLAPGEDARAALLAQPWTHWRDQLLADLSPAHPDLRAKTQRIEVTRYGHAMAVPVPGTRATMATLPLQAGPMSFAHSDWAGYSVFEEAFTLGHRAALRIAFERLT